MIPSCNCLCKHLLCKLSGLCVRAKNTSRKPSHDISHPLGVTSHRHSPLGTGMQNLFSLSGTPLLFFHPPRSGNENDVPLVRGKNSPPWRMRRATLRANCLNEIPVCDEWEVRGLLGSQACAAAGLSQSFASSLQTPPSTGWRCRSSRMDDLVSVCRFSVWFHLSYRTTTSTIALSISPLSKLEFLWLLMVTGGEKCATDMGTTKEGSVFVCIHVWMSNYY